MSAIIIPMDKARAGRRLLALADTKETGLRIKAALKVAGMTQADLQRQIGASSSQITQWGKGRNYPSIPSLLLALPYLEVDLNYIFLGDMAAFPYAKRDALQSAYEELKAEADRREPLDSERGEKLTR